jgi:hypothetical protein
MHSGLRRVVGRRQGNPRSLCQSDSTAVRSQCMQTQEIRHKRLQSAKYSHHAVSVGGGLISPSHRIRFPKEVVSEVIQLARSRSHFILEAVRCGASDQSLKTLV